MRHQQQGVGRVQQLGQKCVGRQRRQQSEGSVAGSNWGQGGREGVVGAIKEVMAKVTKAAKVVDSEGKKLDVLGVQAAAALFRPRRAPRDTREVTCRAQIQ